MSDIFGIAKSDCKPTKKGSRHRANIANVGNEIMRREVNLTESSLRPQMFYQYLQVKTTV